MELRQRLASQAAARARLTAERDVAFEPFAARLEALQDECTAALAGISERIAAHDEATAADDELALEFVGDGEPVTCCVSGLVLLKGDEVVADGLGRLALMAALPQWPAAPAAAAAEALPEAAE
jgi:hypothetical protein